MKLAKSNKPALLLAVICFFLCVQCSKNTNEPLVCGIMAVHAQPNLPALTIQTPNATIASSLNYAAYSAYTELPAGVSMISATNLQTNTTALQTKVSSLSAGKYYSLLLVEDENLLSAVVLTDTIARTDTGKVYLRFVNASPDAGKTNVYAGSLIPDTLFSQLELNPQQPANMASEPRLIEAGVWNFTLVNSNLPFDTLLQLNPLVLEPGGSYTLLLLGYKQPATAQQAPLSVQMILHRL